jgi:hypothetical protein
MPQYAPPQQSGMSRGAKIFLVLLVIGIIVILYFVATSTSTAPIPPGDSSGAGKLNNNSATQPSASSNTPTTGYAGSSNPTVPTSNPTILARTEKINDCGFADLRRGWYDIQGQGVKNDYCRYVDTRPKADGTGGWFSCMLAGSSNAYTPKTRVIDPNLPHEPYVPGTYGCR